MYEIQWIISAGAKMGTESEKYPGHQQLLLDLNLPYFTVSHRIVSYDGFWTQHTRKYMMCTL
jgi:hypothetical protein